MNSIIEWKELSKMTPPSDRRILIAKTGLEIVNEFNCSYQAYVNPIKILLDTGITHWSEMPKFKE